MTQGGDERRQSPRIPVELHVEFRHLGRPSETFAELSKDISAGGVFLDTTVGLTLGTEVAMEISPGPGVRPIKLRAKVVRIEVEPPTTGSTVTARVQGMGLMFLNSDPGEVSRLVSLAKQLSAEER